MKTADRHPYDDELIALEDGMQAAISAELAAIAKAITKKINAENAREIVNRASDANTWQKLRDALAAWMMKSAEFGTDMGRQQIERDVFGVKSAEFTLGMWDVANEAAIAWALRQATSLSREFQMNTTPRIQRLVADWIANSEPIGNLIDRVMGGYLYSEERARTISVTEITRAFARGNIEAWNASGVVEGKQWQTNRDELVCLICAPLRDKTAPLNGSFDGIDSPPAHPRCRCWISPVVIQS
jgi:hypothetical protein